MIGLSPFGPTLNSKSEIPNNIDILMANIQNTSSMYLMPLLCPSPQMGEDVVKVEGQEGKVYVFRIFESQYSNLFRN